MKVSEPTTHAAFDSSEQQILSTLVPEGADANEPLDGLPTAADPAATASAAPAVVAAPAPATPAVDAATAPAAASAEAAPAAEPASAPAAAPAPQGDTRAALRAARHAEKRLRDENQRLADELNDLKARNPQPDTAISDAELAQLEEDFPLQAKIVRQQRELERRLAVQPAPRQAATEFEPLSYDPVVQDVIDGVPQLVAWQYDPAAQDKFGRAIEYDKALALDPDWANKPMAERFTEAARRVEAALGSKPAASPTPSAAPAAAAPATRIDPAAAIAAAPAAGPKGISDFRGGAPANPPVTNYAGMTDEQIMASLPAG